MPELNLKDFRRDFRLPELRLPEMSRDDIAKALGDARKELREVRKELADFRHDFDMPRVDVTSVEIPSVDMSKVDRSRQASRRHGARQRQAGRQGRTQGRGIGWARQGQPASAACRSSWPAS